MHQDHVLHPSCVPEKEGVNQKSKNKKWYSHNKKEINGNKQDKKSIKTKMRGHKLRSGASW